MGLEMMGSFISRILLMAFGYVYPAYKCFKIVERSRLEIFQLLFWCHYWIIVALLTVFERVGDPLLSWLPLYDEAKLAFFIYLWHPKTKGAACIFSVVLRPFITKHEAKIDHYLIVLRLKTADIAALFWHKTASCSQTTLLDLLHNVSSMPTAQTHRNQGRQQNLYQLWKMELLQMIPRRR
ncbi:putative HVA22-like protein g isoform X2 [Benincasa hispida]|uniref:putative HVA22-like protein g isoform X2 n=1 Tax=Benincasa hispida TaxID=102211 RepID=UPI001900505A|nr:putative HVA22-like protein g isoform X2 [Benincasa hispida]